MVLYPNSELIERKSVRKSRHHLIARLSTSTGLPSGPIGERPQWAQTIDSGEGLTCRTGSDVPGSRLGVTVGRKRVFFCHAALLNHPCPSPGQPSRLSHLGKTASRSWSFATRNNSIAMQNIGFPERPISIDSVIIPKCRVNIQPSRCSVH